ncbi:MAG: VWA domain-containing protein [Xanthomonadales bacterium]|nr:VWA domain-containing protein [Xanthomonadales bacterium]
MKRRPVSATSMSFLDIMFCGFGAVVLLVLIMNTHTVQERNEVFTDMRAEVVRMENEVIIGEENRVLAFNSLQATDKDIVLMQGEASRVQDSLLEIEAGLTDLNKQTTASRVHINKLKSDIKGLDKTTQELAKQQQSQGTKVHQFAGEGNRQYLTGLKLSGKRTLILLDASASMLDETIVNIIRLRNMSDAKKRASVKWNRAQGTAEWLISNLPAGSQFQVYLFNTRSKSALSAKQGKWLAAARPEDVAAVVKTVRETIPAGGTSLYHAFAAANAMQPKPDNILLITDGLPTQGRAQPKSTTVSSRQRRQLFERAIQQLPSGVPVNTILLPMEGDAYAAAHFWQLAVTSKGSFLTPARDWP